MSQTKPVRTDGQLSHPPKDSAVPTEMPSIETSYSWVRLVASITLSTLGCVGLWSLAVALPAVQADFDVQRAGASLPYALTMIGFMIGGITVGRFTDRFGILPPFAGGTILMCLGYILTASAPTLPAFAVVSGLTTGLGSAASFAPLVADASLWFDRHRGLAISLATVVAPTWTWRAHSPSTMTELAVAVPTTLT